MVFVSGGAATHVRRNAPEGAGGARHRRPGVGYDNVEVVDAEGRRRDVERRINEPEAIVVRCLTDS